MFPLTQMRPALLALIFSAATITAVAAGQTKQPPAPQKVGEPSVGAQTENLARRVGELEASLLKLNKTVLELQGRLYRTGYKLDSHVSSQAEVSTEEQVYAVSMTQFGAFTVVSKGVSPYLDGYKVRLLIGNLTSANFSGGKINISWGLPFPDFDSKTLTDDLEKYQKSQKQKEFEVTNDFPGGSYTELELSLTPAKPDEIKRISVGVNFTTMWLRNSPVR
jgi:hypothetical protein